MNQAMITELEMRQAVGSSAVERSLHRMPYLMQQRKQSRLAVLTSVRSTLDIPNLTAEPASTRSTPRRGLRAQPLTGMQQSAALWSDEIADWAQQSNFMQQVDMAAAEARAAERALEQARRIDELLLARAANEPQSE